MRGRCREVSVRSRLVRVAAEGVVGARGVWICVGARGGDGRRWRGLVAASARTITRGARPTRVVDGKESRVRWREDGSGGGRTMRPVMRYAERYGVAGAHSLSPRLALDLRTCVRDLSSRSVSGECSPLELGPPSVGDMVAPARLGRRAARCPPRAHADSTRRQPNNTPRRDRPPTMTISSPAWVPQEKDV